MYKLLSWTAVILWMMLIFSLSNQPASQSNDLSKGITEVIIENVEKVAPEAQYKLGDFNHIVRKNAHFFVYLILGILVMNALSRSGKNRLAAAKWAVLICVGYAITDEIHQIFVPGRGAQVKDVLIDSAGAVVGCGLYMAVSRAIRSK
jgi:VanZ family protein